ncbi:MAG: DEAD/DEAH box helicase, partial [Phycisphaerae bacterium]
MAVATKKRSRKKPKLSRLHKPAELSLNEWQIGLRRQFGPEQSFKLDNLGTNRVFSEFAVTNPESGGSYRVVVRGEGPGVNYCTCPDYEVNTLGTCKHIEFTLDRLRRKHAAMLRKGYLAPYPEIYLRYGTRREVVFSPGVDAPPALRRLAASTFKSDGTLRLSAIGQFDTFAHKARKVRPDIRIYEDVLIFIARARDHMNRQKRLDRQYAGKTGTSALRRLLKVPLYPYQREGALFAAKAGRSIIADDMGLGKTIQAIAAAEILARDSGISRVLIVCPTSLKYQWPNEIEKFSTRRVRIIEGLSHRRKAMYADDEFFKIVNYEVIHRDLDAIAAWQPDLIILDEAQRIKNWQTRTAQSVKQLESPYAIVLTGTPLENRLEELHSITEFVDRHRLGPLFAFKAEHEICEDDSSKVIGYRNLNKITKTLGPILIRRTKEQVLRQLPPRLDKQFFVPMTEEQMVHHADNQETVARIVAKWRRYKFITEADQLRLRIALQYMRMSCDSTYLIDKQTRHGTKVDELSKLLEEIFEDPKAKIVIFSQWVRMNELVAEMLNDRDWGHVHLHGGVPGKERKHL